MSESARILIADDDPDIRNFMALALDSAGYRTFQAADGLEALRLAIAGDAALVLLDIGMPGLPGDAVIRILNAEAGPRPPAVIFVTAHTRPHDRAAGLELGALDYIVKPFEPEELVARVRLALERSD